MNNYRIFTHLALTISVYCIFRANSDTNQISLYTSIEVLTVLCYNVCNIPIYEI